MLDSFESLIIFKIRFDNCTKFYKVILCIVCINDKYDEICFEVSSFFPFVS